ncbi:MAG: peroxidase family protein, partial [Nitrospira sp.]
MRVQAAGLIGLSLINLLACHGEPDNTLQPKPSSAPLTANVYSRMFPELPSFASPTDEVREQAKKLGVKGGLLDALDNQPGQNNPDNPNMTEGVHFFGQFLTHDLALALNAPLLAQTDPRQTTNLRTTKFDLDSVYGGGPDGSPELYEPTSGDIKFRIEAIPGSEQVSKRGAVRFDLPRDPTNQAIIPDSRNDQNVVISQFHLAMLRFHNAVVDRLRSDPAQAQRSARDLFEEARRQVQWHYQWIILHEYLPLTIGQERVDEILQNGPRFYRPLDRTQDALFRNSNGDLLIPVEFAVAAYRFGHSQVRPNYRINFGPDAGAPVILPIFDDSANSNDVDPNDMRGGKRAPRRFIDWQTFFQFDSNNFRFNKKIDTKLSSALMQLPGSRGPA